jgi:hypothetical protein
MSGPHDLNSPRLGRVPTRERLAKIVNDDDLRRYIL